MNCVVEVEVGGEECEVGEVDFVVACVVAVCPCEVGIGLTEVICEWWEVVEIDAAVEVGVAELCVEGVVDKVVEVEEVDEVVTGEVIGFKVWVLVIGESNDGVKEEVDVLCVEQHIKIKVERWQGLVGDGDWCTDGAGSALVGDEVVEFDLAEEVGVVGSEDECAIGIEVECAVCFKVCEVWIVDE